MSTAEQTELGRIWALLTGGLLERQPYLHPSLRRFNIAIDRYSPEDSIVDLLIAAESLFLHDSGEPRDRGELRFRLAQRAAFFVESPVYTKRQVFEVMRRAYDVRSELVHGGSVGLTRLPNNPGGVPLAEFVAAVEELIRRGLRKALTVAEAEPRFGSAGYWADLLFGE